MTRDMTAQLLTIVGIFTALAFLLFGGINFLGSLLTGMKDVHIYRLITVGCLLSLGMLNVVFVFLYCVSKMTGLSLKSNTMSHSFRDQYPVIFWSDYILFFLLLLFLNFSQTVERGSGTWLDALYDKNPNLVSGVITFLIALGALIPAFIIMIKKHRKTVKKEDTG